jgi:hypothetical protein
MFDNVIAEKSNKRLLIFTRINKLFPVRSLASTQEEADTRIILHALYSDQLYQKNNVQGCIVVKSPEVLVLYVHYFPKMKNTSELWFQTGLIRSTKDCRHSLDIRFRLRSTESSMSGHSIRDKSLN